VTLSISESYIKTYESATELSTVVTETKICSKCHLPFPIDGFYFVKKGSERRSSYCKSCSNKTSKEYVQNNHEKRSESKRLWKEKNPKAVKSMRKTNYDNKHEDRIRYSKEWRDKYPEKVRESNRNSNLKKKGVDTDWYNITLSEQKGRCALCGSTDPKTATGRFYIDHDHSCCPRNHACKKCRRGLLCSPCNARLGHIENEIWFKQAKGYLAKYKRRDASGNDQPSLFDGM
jgi:hypothetical protein